MTQALLFCRCRFDLRGRRAAVRRLWHPGGGGQAGGGPSCLAVHFGRGSHCAAYGGILLWSPETAGGGEPSDWGGDQLHRCGLGVLHPLGTAAGSQGERGLSPGTGKRKQRPLFLPDDRGGPRPAGSGEGRGRCGDGGDPDRLGIVYGRGGGPWSDHPVASAGFF